MLFPIAYPDVCKTGVGKEPMKNFLRDTSGNFAISGAIAAVVTITLVGMAIDLSRLDSARSHAQNAADLAALAAAKETDMTNDQLKEFARAFFLANKAGEGEYKAGDIEVKREKDGVVNVSLDAVLHSTFMKIGDFPSLNFSVEAAAVLGDQSTSNMGCVYLTDPRNTGLKMSGSSGFSTNCVIMITTNGKALDLRGSATATFAGICANGSISAATGAVTPDRKIDDCTVVVDPFAGMSPPTELSAGCLGTIAIEIKGGESASLPAGVHCGKISVANKGLLELEPGVHYFKAGLDVHGGGTLEGDEVLLAFDKAIDTYTLSGKLDVNGLKSGDYKGFVIYHEDYSGNSNKIIVGANASFRADGVIYLPNTNMRLYTATNDLATQSILVADRFELEGNAAFHAKIDKTSMTPLPEADLSVVKKQSRLVY
jgi:hypothetical protein